MATSSAGSSHYAGILTQQVDETAVVDVLGQGFAAAPVASRSRERRALAASCVFLDSLAVQARDLEMVGQRIMERGRARFAARHPFVAVEPQGLKNLRDQVEIVLRNHAAGVAGFVAKTGSFDGKRKMERRSCWNRCGSGSLLIDQWRKQRVVARESRGWD